MGIDKVKRLKRFNDWVKAAEAKMDFMGLTSDTQKVNLLRSWTGPDLILYWEREVGIRFKATAQVDAVGNVPEIPA